MPLFNPVYIFVVPFLFLFTVPLALLAGVTTTVAFSVLVVRVVTVYLDMAVALLPHYIIGRRGFATGPGPSASSPEPSVIMSRNSYSLHGRRRSSADLGVIPATNDASAPPPSGSGASTPTLAAHALARSTSMSSHHQHSHHHNSLHHHHRRRRPSSGSVVSAAGIMTPASEAGLGLIPSVGMDRDFEGMGGWRLGSDDDDEEDNELWTSINSRLEFPDRQHGSGSGRSMHHYRSQSGGALLQGIGDSLFMTGRNYGSESSKSSYYAYSNSINTSRPRAPSTGAPPTFTALSGADGGFSFLNAVKSARRAVA